MHEDDELYLVQEPGAARIHLLLEAPDEFLGVSLCGDGHAGDWPRVRVDNAPLPIRDLCPDCLQHLGWLAIERRASYWPPALVGA